MQNNHPEINVLLLGLGGNVSQGILKALRNTRIPCKIIGACISPQSAGLYFCDHACISPFASSPNFIPWVKEICRKEKISIIMSGVEEVLTELAQWKDNIERETGAKAFVSDPAQLAIGRDKLLTCQWLEKNNFFFPAYCSSENWENVEQLAEKTGYRLIAKPRFGKGSQGIIHINAKDSLKKLKGLQNYVIEEEIGTENDEYTIGCYQLKSGKIKSIAMKRKLVSGTTSSAIICHDSRVLAAAEGICKKFSPVGPLNVQLRLDQQGRAVCFELNVRYSGTTPIRSHFGFEEVTAALLEYVLEESAEDCFHVRNGMAFRFWDEIYVDENAQKKLLESGSLDSPQGFAIVDQFLQV